MLTTQRVTRRVCAERSDRPLRQAMISSSQDAQSAVSREYTRGAEMFGTPVTRFVQAMVRGAAKTNTAQANSSRPPTARSIGSRHILMMLGSLIIRAAVSTAVGIQKEMETSPRKPEESSASLTAWFLPFQAPGSPHRRAPSAHPVACARDTRGSVAPG